MTLKNLNLIEKLFCYLLLLIFFGLGFYIRMQALQSATIGGHEWITRDFDRAFNIVDGTYIPLAGPETNAGGRLPGPFMYFWLAIPLLFHYSYESIFNFNFILNIGSIIGLFFILKKYFNLRFAAFASTMLSVSAHHISAVNHPINPAFVFPFITIFIGFYLELILSEKPKMFPWIVLTLSLAVQFHYSMAVYALVPVSAALLYKLKPSKNTLIKSFIVAILVFTPFMLFKKQIYEPGNDGSASTFRRLNLTTVQFIKTISFQNTLERITQTRPFGGKEDKGLHLTRQILLSVIFYSFVFWTVLQIRKNGWGPYRKEVSILIFFIIPVGIYEIVNPFRDHYWYNYVFILPTVLLLASFSEKAITSIRFKWLGTIIVLAFTIILGIHSAYTYKQVMQKKIKLEKDLTWGTYQNSKLFLSELMAKLNLTPQEVFDRVYFLDFHPSSLKRLEFAYLRSKENLDNSKKNTSKNECFFVADINGLLLQGTGSRKFKNATSYSLASIRRNLFLEDSTINRLESFDLSFGKYRFPIVYSIIPYIPKQKQSCYANSFNPFVTTKSIRDLLIQAKHGGKKPYNKIYFQEVYDHTGQLTKLDGKYVVKNSETQTPFKLSVFVFRKDGKYHLNTEIESYYFWGQRNFRIDYLKLRILNVDPNLPSTDSWRPLARAYNKNSIKSTIIPRASLLASPNHLASWGHWSYNQVWRKETILPENLNLQKDRFYIDLGYEITAEEDRLRVYGSTKHSYLIELKSPKSEIKKKKS